MIGILLYIITSVLPDSSYTAIANINVSVLPDSSYTAIATSVFQCCLIVHILL